jgi:hypothetical protein
VAPLACAASSQITASAWSRTFKEEPMNTASPWLLMAALLAAPAVANAGQFNVLCAYSHTLPDDPIMFPGKPVQSMVHDFFGNTSTDAFTANADLLALPDNSCENVADSSAYWAPQLRRAGGTQIVRPKLQKTYYRAIDVLNYPVVPFPPGLQLIGGNPMATGPTPPTINFFCAYAGYTSTKPSSCPVDPVAGAQFNIGVLFPDCWDGRTLAPSMSYRNAVYSRNGACPADYPVHIPQLNFNLEYHLGFDGDLRDAELSLDPVMVDGQLQPRWGSLYSAHADFMHGWQPASAQYMVEYCLNRDLTCNKDIPYTYAESTIDSTISSAAPTSNFGQSMTLDIEGGSSSRTALLRFAIPQGVSGVSFNRIFLRLFGGNATDSAAYSVTAHALANAWDEDTVTWTLAPACGNQVGSLYLDHVPQYRNLDVTQAAIAAMARGETEISFCIRGPANGRVVSLHSGESGDKPLLFFQTLRPLPVGAQ